MADPSKPDEPSDSELPQGFGPKEVHEASSREPKKRKRPRPAPTPEDPYSLASWIMHGDPDKRRRDEEENLRKLEELTERQEKLQQAARERDAINSSRRILAATREQPSAPNDTVDWDEVVAGEKALRNSETVRSKSEPQPPRTQKVSRVVAGGLFALFLGSITQALQLFGIINATSGHVFMFIAFMVGILIITTEVLPLKPTKHKVAAIIVLAVLLGAIDAAASLYANKRDAGKASSGASTAASQPTPEELQDNVFLSAKYPSLGNPKTFTFFGDRNYGSVSFQARFGLSTNFSIILLVHSTEPEPGIAVGDCLTAINHYQAIVDNLKVEAKKRSPEFIDFIVTPNLVCHYDYATDIAPEKVEALKRIALSKDLVLSIEGPRGPK